jgi:hypothetical protein
MASQTVREVVAAFWATLRAADWQIEVMRDCKQLHDLLHTLQIHCYDRIVQEARRFPEDEVARENLTAHEMTLKRTIASLREVAKRPTLSPRDTSWIEDLEPARTALRKAMQDRDAKQLNMAAHRLGRVLNTQPTVINTRLNDAARTLPLPQLLQAMQGIWVKLCQLEFDAQTKEKVTQFESGVNTLADLNGRLPALLSDHDAWQLTDLELRLCEFQLDKETTDLELSWPKLKALTEMLCSSSKEEWAKEFRSSAAELDGALVAQRHDKVRYYFRPYRRQALERFYQIDETLKKQCEELRGIKQPLEQVLGRI